MLLLIIAMSIAEARDCLCQFRNEGPEKTRNKKMETQPHAKRGSRFALLLITALLENFSGFRSASLEHYASSAEQVLPALGCKDRQNSRKFQTFGQLFCPID